MATQLEQPKPGAGQTRRVDLPVGGMNCASCAARVEKTLAGVPGVKSAGVNFATTTATVEYDPDQVGVDELCDAVKDAGYSARPPREEHSPAAALDEEQKLRAQELAALQRKFWTAAALTTPIVILSMGMIQFPFRNFFL